MSVLPAPSSSTPTPATSASVAPAAAPVAIDLKALDAATGEPSVPPWAGACEPTTNGAWVMVLDDLSQSDDRVYARWALGHVDRKGKALFAPLSLETYANPRSSAEELTSVGDRGISVTNDTENGYSLTTRSFDWDGDGEDELALVADTWNMQRYAGAGRIWTYKNNVLRLYGPTRSLSIAAVKDVDQDGRPDLVVNLGSTSYLSSRMGKSLFRDPIGLVAHSLADGTFSLKDDVAIAAASASCPTPTAAISTQKDVICARLHGAAAEDVARRLARTCEKDSEAGECDDSELGALADAPVPLVIPRSRK